MFIFFSTGKHFFIIKLISTKDFLLFGMGIVYIYRVLLVTNSKSSRLNIASNSSGVITKLNLCQLFPKYIIVLYLNKINLQTGVKDTDYTPTPLRKYPPFQFSVSAVRGRWLLFLSLLKAEFPLG